ncbi:MAG: hypothetical protein RLZZ227_3083 [Pseudomonadota bacterium]|jgi:hypothetical protein
MPPFLVVVLLCAFLGACIWFLHRTQVRRTVETADRAAPLPALDDGKLPDFVATPPTVAVAAAAANDNWLGEIRSLRDSDQLDAALALSRAHFPKTQAFQQAAIILRQQIRSGLDQFQPVGHLLVQLFHTAALADLFRSSTSHKPLDPAAALAAMRDMSFQYATIGHMRLKLLNKSDVRALEQLWGNPTTHRHVEDVLGEAWLKWCRPSPDLAQ